MEAIADRLNTGEGQFTEIHKDIKKMIADVAWLQAKVAVWGAISGTVAGIAAGVVGHIVGHLLGGK